MVSAFVIGLREGLETVVVLGAIALFLTHQGRRHQLRVIWFASAAAASLCVLIAFSLRIVIAGLSPVMTNRVDAIVDVAAVVTVTYMVVWMRRFPKDLVHDTDARAARRLRGGSATALASMAFFVVLREGFEVSIYVVALEGNGVSTHVTGAIGAIAGVLLSVLIGVVLFRSRVAIDIGRFFRATAAVLVVSTAGLAMSAIQSANLGGWLVFAQRPQFDWSALSPPGTILSSFVTGLFGVQPYPTLIDVVVWLVYLVPMLLVVILPRGLPTRLLSQLQPRTRRLVLISGACSLAILAVGGPILRAGLRTASANPGAGPPQMALPTQGLNGGSYLLFRNTALGPDYGRLGLVASANPGGPRALTSLTCDRVDFEGGVGLCLELPTSGLDPRTTATVFDTRFHRLRTVVLFGFPSRVRVSPDGRYGAVTTFVRGDSYATANMYSTRTDVIDMHSGKILFDLSQLHVSKDGRAFIAPNFNFWGVTFSTDGKTFYATLGTGNSTYLIEGNMQTRRASVVASNVECPSLSPNGKEIAFKRRLSGPTVRWRLSVLDLATGKIHPLAETRSVDDQVEWLDNSTILYGVLQNSAIAAMNPESATTPSLTNGATLATNTWSVPANGGGKPQLVSRDTWSEVVTSR